MSKQIESDALILINKQLGIAGPLQVPTFLDDANLTLIMEVTDAVRRSRALGVVQGWNIGVMQNVHAGAGSLVTVVDAYAPGTAAVAGGAGGFPPIVPSGYDVWLIGGMVTRNSGAGGLNSGGFSLDPATVNQAWGIDDMGAAVTASRSPLQIWTSIDVFGAGLDAAGRGYVDWRLRIARGTEFRWQSDAAAAATFQLILILGVFPEGMGQDIAS